MPYDLSMWPRITRKHETERWPRALPVLFTFGLTVVVYIWFDRRVTALTRGAWFLCLARFPYQETHTVFINSFIFSNTTG